MDGVTRLHRRFVVILIVCWGVLICVPDGRVSAASATSATSAASDSPPIVAEHEVSLVPIPAPSLSLSGPSVDHGPSQRPATESSMEGRGALPVPDGAAARLSDPPSVTGQVTVGTHRVRPYIGAGYGNGYTSELDRALSGQSPAGLDTNLRNLFGPSLVPSEVRLGIRIPF